MNLHEYQSKQLFADYGLPVSPGFACDTPEEVAAKAKEIGGDKWVVKAQVHAGGRGKAGGVKLVDSPEEAAEFAKKWLGQRLVTFQTDEHGQPVTKILVETCTDIARELYLSAVLDRATRRVVFMASTEGGVEIEKVAEETPEKILKAIVDPLVGAQPYQAREIAFQLGLEGKQINQFAKIFVGLAKLFEEKDLALIEVNPLVITDQGDLHCLDAKINVDGSALFRHPDIKALDETFDLYKDATASMPRWDLERAGRPPVDAPFHPGAIKYLEEQGIWTEADQAWNDRRLKRLEALRAAWKDALAANEDADDQAFAEAWAEARRNTIAALESGGDDNE